MSDPGGRAGDDGRLIDVSIAVSDGTPPWPGDTPFSCRWTWDMRRGDSVNVSCMAASPHVGTHADAPFHVDPGWHGADTLPIEAFVGPATVADVRASRGPIERSALGTAQVAGGRLLLRTGRGIADGAFPAAWPWLSRACVEELLAGGLRLLGVDAPSVDGRESRTLEVHRTLFSGGACVLENLDLRHVEPGDYELLAMPMRMVGLDAAPVRAALRRLPVR